MGVVYEAEQQSLRRRVALKVLPRVASDENGLARFQREARAAARLHHSNIVPVFQVGQDGEHAYYAMQLIEGQGLDAVINDLRRLPLERSEWWQAGEQTSDLQSDGSSSRLQGERSEVLRGLADGSTESNGSQRFYRSVAQIGLQASDALAYAHDRGIIHRDVKPSNLLLDAGGVVWVSDFGLAMTNEGQLTRSQDLLGTLRYMSPERFQHQCDARSDIYALGITLYELLVMEPAYRMVDRLHLVKSILNEEPPAPRKLDPYVPLDLETIILKSIEKEPRDRYQSAVAMAEDLRRFLNDEPIQARRVRSIERLLRWRRRNRSLAAALSAVAALILLLVIVLSWTSIRQNELRQLAEQRGDMLLDNLYFSQMNVAGQAATQRFGVDTIRAQLAEWDPKSAGRDLRNWEWYYLYGLSHGEEFASEPLGNGFCWACDHSPDGKKLVNTKNGWGVQVRNAKIGTVLAQRELGSARFVDWSPDGKKIAVGRFDNVCSVLDAKTLETIRDFTIPFGGEAWCVRWHPNSTWLAEINENEDQERKREIRIYDVESGKQVFAPRHPEVPGLGSQFLSWNPDGSKLAASGSGITLLWSFIGGQPKLEKQFSGNSATWSPDGSMLAVSRAGSIWDALSERQLAGSNGSIAWAPCSKQIAVGGHDGIIRIYDVAMGGIHAQRIFQGHTSEIGSVSWSSDGQWLASCGLRDETVRTWRVSESDRIQLFSGQSGIYLPELSDDGSRIASSVYFSRSIFVWDLAGKLRVKREFENAIGRVAPSPNGKTIAFCTESPSVCLWNTVTDSVVEISSGLPMFDLAWSKIGELAGLSKSGDIVVWNANGDLLQEIMGAHNGGRSVHWSPGGQQIASC
ncbi:MAG: WD40 repeat domain-containing serine/threonine protein kinase, partial [Pirellulales bacterium]|nr:WD40 repeat domain-containing serine/threonine protein kinase [Pirellulales bacterium]